MPKDPCSVHSGVAPVPLGSKPPPEGVLRARVVESQSLKTVALKEATVIGLDPYGSGTALERQVQLAGVGNAQAPLITTGEIPVNSGTPPPANVPAPRPLVVPPPPNSAVKLEQPEPLKFN